MTTPTLEKARALAEHLGCEVMTPQAAAKLFGISLAAVRAARLRGHVAVAFTLSIGGRPVHMLNLRRALRYWGENGKVPTESEIDALRDNSTVLWDPRSGSGAKGRAPAHYWSVLTTTPLVQTVGPDVHGSDDDTDKRDGR